MGGYMNERYLHGGNYEATAEVNITECQECGVEKACMVFVAEHNAGELHTCPVCKDCMRDAIAEINEVT